MAVQTEKPQGQTRCTVDVAPAVVDAGAILTLKCAMSCTPACDLRGSSLLIEDGNGARVGSAELSGYDGETNETDDCTLKAPAKPGAYTWSAVCPAHVADAVSYPEVATPFSFTVRPHQTSVVVWDVPSAVVVGERFAIKVGIKCSSQCKLTDREFVIYDDTGTEVAAGTLGSEPWKGTSALYAGEVALEAPKSEGLRQWMAKVNEGEFEIPGADAALPHVAGSTTFGVRFVAGPECVVTVEAFDHVKQTPLKGARVTMHPYRAVCDERGVAELRVAKGQYRIFVSQTKYTTLGRTLDVTGDVTTKAELELEPPTERD